MSETPNTDRAERILKSYFTHRSSLGTDGIQVNLTHGDVTCASKHVPTVRRLFSEIGLSLANAEQRAHGRGPSTHSFTIASSQGQLNAAFDIIMERLFQENPIAFRKCYGLAGEHTHPYTGEPWPRTPEELSLDTRRHGVVVAPRTSDAGTQR